MGHFEPSSGALRWYLAQLKPNGANLALRNLARQGFRTFLPLTHETERHRGRFVSRKRPLFPGYVFVGVPPAMARWRAINSTQGVSRLVSFGADPTPVPGALIEGLMLRCDDGGVLSDEVLSAGAEVRLTQGPFAGFVGHIETMEKARRAYVLLDIMSQAVRVSVPMDGMRRA